MKYKRKQRIQEEQYKFPYHYFDLFCDMYKLRYSIGYRSLLNYITNLIKSEVSNKKKLFILDAGCGDGRFIYEIRHTKYADKITLIGVDFSKKAITFAKAFNPSIKFYLQNLESLNLPYKFDIIIVKDVLEHIHPLKLKRVIRLLYKHLKPQGKIIVVVPTENISLLEKHYQHFTEDSLINILDPYFTVENIQGCFKINEGIIFKLLLKISFFIFPLRKKQIGRKFFLFLYEYYVKHCFLDDTKKCKGIILIGTKNS